ncbi:nSTAND1 domain-containing NTPase [Lentzea aerocolonigenes]|uniref:nSTAND1 domain-containing NTPase n=1 Tax=Lentzea aerocolonigenes TaxID=68170 RepID=UPI0004C359EB|nr:helix-turn-helix domain-containing protein [Lentzea aerocolonigenes]MCP2244592.1 WD40 repeat [Lentzea aerocolonigenes]
MPRPEKPLDPFAGPVEQFAFDLRKLREKAGSPGYRELGRLSHYSASTLADAARGQRLPSLAVTLAFVRACGGDEELWERRWREIGETAPDQRIDSPYVGLKAFTEHDADRFFGRERLVGKLLAKLEQHDTVLVVGASGSGKSSLLRAGLLARSSGELITPSTHPALPRTEGLLVVDQFEEIFALPHRDEFIAALTGRGHKTVIGIRADFYGHCARYPGLATAVEDAQVLVGPMTTDELRKAITQPAVEVGCALETGLVARLIADATGEPGVLPHVSHALLETWQRKRGNTLTLTSYHESGGIARAIANTAENAYSSLDERQRTQARQVFLRLVNPGEGTEDTKRRVKRSELAADEVVEHLANARILTVDDDSVEISHEAVIRGWPRLKDWLAEARDDLRVHRRLTAAAADWEAHGRDPGSLYRGVPLTQATDWALRDPAALNAEEKAFLDASRAAAEHELATEKRRTTNLRRVVALLAALLLVATTATVFAVRAQQQTTEQRTIALAQKAIAEANGLQDRDPGLASQLRLAAYRLTGLPAARDSLLSTFAAPQVTLVKGHQDATSYALFSPDNRLMATAADDKALIIWDFADPHHPTELGRVHAGENATHNMAFSPDSRTLATANWDGHIRLFDLTDPRKPAEKARISGHDGQVQAVQFTPNGRTLVSSGKDKTIRVWDVSGALVRTIQAHDQLVHGLSLNREGTTIASASWDGTVKLWDLATGTQLSTIDPAPGNFASDAAVFSSAGLLATGADNGDVRLWDVTDPRNPVQLSLLTGHMFSIHTLAFSPDGKFLASGGGDKTTRVWDVTDPRKVRLATALAGHTDTLWSVNFSPDSRRMVTATTDAEARVLDLANLNYAHHTWTIWKLDYDQRGRYLATVSSDGTIKLWRPDDRHAEEIATLPKLAPDDEAYTVDVHPGGNVLFEATAAGNALWDVTDPAKPRELNRAITRNVPIVAADFSHDGRTLAVGEEDGVISLWNVTDPAHPVKSGSFKIPETDTVWQLEFSQDDRTLVIANGSRELQLWDVGNPASPRAHPSLRTDDNPDPIRRGGQAGREEVMTVVVHGNLMAFANMGSSGALYDISDPAQPRKVSSLPNDGGPLQRLAFSPDGTLLAAGTTDDVIRVWDVRDPRNPQVRAVLHGHTERVWGVAFAPDNRTLVTTGADRTVRVWDIDVEATAARVCATTTPHLSTRHWEQYFPGVEPRPLC